MKYSSLEELSQDMEKNIMKIKETYTFDKMTLV